MVLTRCCSWATARRSVDAQVLLVIAAALGLGKAVEKTGVGSTIASLLIDAAGNNPWVALAVIYGVTVLFTEFITNSAAAVLVFPMAVATSQALGCTRCHSSPP